AWRAAEQGVEGRRRSGRSTEATRSAAPPSTPRGATSSRRAGRRTPYGQGLGLAEERQHPLRTLKGHTSAVNYAEWSPNGTSIVSVSSDRTARVWNWRTGKALAI